MQIKVRLGDALKTCYTKLFTWAKSVKKAKLNYSHMPRSRKMLNRKIANAPSAKEVKLDLPESPVRQRQYTKRLAHASTRRETLHKTSPRFVDRDVITLQPLRIASIFAGL